MESSGITITEIEINNRSLVREESESENGNIVKWSERGIIFLSTGEKRDTGLVEIKNQNDLDELEFEYESRIVQNIIKSIPNK